MSTIGADVASIAAVNASFHMSAVAELSEHASKTSTGVATLLFAHLRPSHATSALTMLRQAAAQYTRTALLFRLPAGEPLSSVVRSTCRAVRPRMLSELSPAAAVAAEAAASGKFPAARGRVALAADTVSGLDAAALRDPRAFAFSLFVFTTAFGPAIDRNERIVIYGMSDAALMAASHLAVLESSQRYPHLTIVGDRLGGIAAEFVVLAALSPYEVSRLSLACAQHIPGSLFQISRPERTITLSTGTRIIYDRLLLLPDLEEPTSTALGFNEGASPLPNAIYALGTNRDSLADDIIGLAETIASAEEANLELPRIVIYGDSLSAVVFTASLLDRGIPPSSVMLVQPSRSAGGVKVATALEEASMAGEELAEGAQAHDLIAALLPVGGAALTPASLYPALAVDYVLRSAGVERLVGAKLEGLRPTQEGIEIELSVVTSEPPAENAWNEPSQVSAKREASARVRIASLSASPKREAWLALGFTRDSCSGLRFALGSMA